MVNKPRSTSRVRSARVRAALRFRLYLWLSLGPHPSLGPGFWSPLCRGLWSSLWSGLRCCPTIRNRVLRLRLLRPQNICNARGFRMSLGRRHVSDTLMPLQNVLQVCAQVRQRPPRLKCTNEAVSKTSTKKAKSAFENLKNDTVFLLINACILCRRNGPAPRSRFCLPALRS